MQRRGILTLGCFKTEVPKLQISCKERISQFRAVTLKELTASEHVRDDSRNLHTEITDLFRGCVPTKEQSYSEVTFLV